MSSRDLQGCAQLLGHFLDTDKTKSAQTHSYLKSLRKEKPVVAKGKGKSKKGRSHMKKQTSTTLPPNVDKIDEDIQRMIRIKRAREGHPILNDTQDQELPSKDTDASDITAPYNQRLMSSTPHDTPVKIAGKASVSNLLQGDVGEHALNSFEYIRNINPPKESPRPKLKEGQVDYIAHPQKVTTGSRGAFTQEHLEGMRQAYMSCLTETQLRQHQAGSQAPNQKTNFPSTIPQPVVLSGQNPTVLYPASHLIQPANANIAAQIGGYNLSQHHQNANIYHITTSAGTNTAPGTNDYTPNYYVISSGAAGIQAQDNPTATAESAKAQIPAVGGNKYNTAHDPQVLREPTEKELAQYSLYSTTSTSLPQHENPPTYSSEGHVTHRTISPFKPGDPRESSTQQVSRKEMIKSALKIALDDDGYLKSGPISPFKAGTKGFSACVTQREESAAGGTGEEREPSFERDKEEHKRDVDDSEEGMEEDAEGDKTLVDSVPPSRDSSPQPTTQQKGAKASNSAVGIGKEQVVAQSEKVRQVGSGKAQTSTDSKRTAKVATATTKNSNNNKKMVQFVASKKRGKEGRSVVKKVNGSSGGGKSTPGVTNTENNISSNKVKNGKTKVKLSQQEMKGGDGKAAVVVSSKQREENKENLHPQETAIAVSKETTDGMGGGSEELKVLDVAKYSSTMKKIQHLVKEVRAVPGIKLDKEGKRLLKELHDTVQTGTSNWQTDFDLAMQPTRSENAQLRRKVRILTQQLKDKERDLQNAEKPDPNFMVVHLQMKLFNVENEAKALRGTNNKLKEDIRLYLCQLEKLSAERADLLNLFGNKNAGSNPLPTAATQGREADRAATVHTELDAYKRHKQGWDKEREELLQGNQLVQLSLKEKEVELAAMQELVRSLQGSMLGLMEDLQSSKPCPSQSVNRLNKELDHVQSIINSREQQLLRKPNQATDASPSISHAFRPLGNQQEVTSRTPRQGRSVSEERRPNNAVLDNNIHRAVRSPENHARIRVPERRAISQQREPPPRDPITLGLQAARNPAHRSATDLQRRGGGAEENSTAEKGEEAWTMTTMRRTANAKNLGMYSQEEIDQIYREEQDRWDKDMMPRTYTRSSSSKASPGQQQQSFDTDTATGLAAQEDDDGEERYTHIGRGRSSGKSPRIPKTHPTEKVGLYLMDQPGGVNINKMAQSLSASGHQHHPTPPAPQRVSMSTTNPETDITDYNMFPGMSPMKGSAFSKLDPFIRDVIVNSGGSNTRQGFGVGGEVTEDKRQGAGFNSSSGQPLTTYGGGYGFNREDINHQHQHLKSHSVPIFEQEGSGGAQNIVAAIPVAAPISSRTSESRDTVSSAPTVKELLTPLADRMERFRSMTEVKKSGAMRAINFDVEEEREGEGRTAGRMEEKRGSSGVVDLDDTYNMDLEGELDKLQYEVSSEDTSTFSEVDDPLAMTAQELVGPAVVSNGEGENPNQSESRYSVTDYFNKYPTQKPAMGVNSSKNRSGLCIQEHSKEEEAPIRGSVATTVNEQIAKNAWQGVEPDGGLIALDNHVEALNLPSDEDDDDQEEQRWVDKVIFSPNGIPMIFDDTNDEIESIEVNIDDEQIAAEFRNLRDLSDKEQLTDGCGGDCKELSESSSPQNDLYKGTDLDTSLSSINEGDYSVGTATTTTSISSVDDRVFRQGLANLDANIARVQQSLRQKLY